MKHLRILALAAVAVAVGTATAPAGAYTRPGRVVDRVSVSSTGAQANDESDPAGAGQGQGIAMTPDGRYVAFASIASNLVPGASSRSVVTKRTDVFVRDRWTGRTRIASVGWDGSPASSLDPTCGGSGVPALTPDGRYVAFTSCDDNLVPGPGNAPRGGDKNLWDDVFVRDLKTGRTVRASTGLGGAEGNGSSGEATISADGRYVAFLSAADNLVTDVCPTDTVHHLACRQGADNGVINVSTPPQVYVRDLVKGVTTMVSVGLNGSPADGGAYDPSISQDGRLVVFTSEGDNMRDEDLNACPLTGRPSCPDIYLHDRVTHRTELISVGLNGRSGLDQSGRTLLRRVQAISADGRYVAFRSNATGLVPRDKTPTFNTGMYVRDRKTGRTERVTVDSNGEILGSCSCSVSLSPDGRYASFNMSVQACAPAPGAIGLRDRVTGATQMVGRQDYRGRDLDCSEYFNEYGGEVSAGGRYVAFSTNGKRLVPNDTNAKADIFVTDRGTSLGVGGLAGAGALDVAGVASFASSGVAARDDAVADATSPAPDGTDLIRASVAYRPATADLFVRLELQRMPLFALASPLVVYGLDLTAGNARYQVRAARTGADASFGLYRRDGAAWTRVATLRGGYGTTGQEVVVAVPLGSLGLGRGGTIRDAVGFTAQGSFDLGAVDVVDRVRLT
ncbi:MAG: hypothetical protein QOE45_649 [Frankiaceae bacterium]|nr:hypothetical protein [Frankiaceae bacterium]